TVTPVRPSNVYFMAPTPGVVMEQFYRKSIRRGCKDRKRKRPRTLAVRGHFFCERVKPGLVGRRDLDVFRVVAILEGNGLETLGLPRRFVPLGEAAGRARGNFLDLQVPKVLGLFSITGGQGSKGMIEDPGVAAQPAMNLALENCLLSTADGPRLVPVGLGVN